MEYTVRFKLTSDLTPEDWDAYVKAFNDVFNKDYTVEQLKSKYTGNCWGYSMHGLLYVEDLLVGGQTFMPQKVDYKGREILLANGCDSFTLKDYRDDPMAMMKARKPAYEYMKAHGVSGTFGSTYKAFVKYLTHFLGVKVIGMPTNWVLPVSYFHGFLGLVINPVWRTCVKILLSINTLRKRKLYGGDELFKPVGYYTPSAYYTTFKQLKNGRRCNYYISSKNHLVIIHDDFETVADFAGGVKELLADCKYRVRAVEYRTGCRLPFPFYAYKKDEIMNGKLWDESISMEDFCDFTKWRYKRGYFD